MIVGLSLTACRVTVTVSVSVSDPSETVTLKDAAVLPSGGVPEMTAPATDIQAGFSEKEKVRGFPSGSVAVAV